MSVQASERLKEAQLQELARSWGKIFAQQGYGEAGPGVEVDFAAIEEFAGMGARALVQGIIREAVWKQALELGDTQPCPDCGRDCRLDWKERLLKTRFGEVNFPEPCCHCPGCRRDFFPSAGNAAPGRPRL
jgi:hypothetical protein